MLENVNLANFQLFLVNVELILLIDSYSEIKYLYWESIESERNSSFIVSREISRKHNVWRMELIFTTCWVKNRSSPFCLFVAEPKMFCVMQFWPRPWNIFCSLLEKIRISLKMFADFFTILGASFNVLKDNHDVFRINQVAAFYPALYNNVKTPEYYRG